MDGAGAPAGPLAGVRVVDLTRVVAGPWCTRELADLGADVVKVEPVPAGGRAGWGRPRAGVDAGKRSVALDLRHPDGADAARRLVAGADVVVENFRPGVMDRLGLGAEALTAAHPRLVYASVSGFGQTGPLAPRRAFGATAHAEAGLLWVQQRATGADAPFAPGVTVADLLAAAACTRGILTALYTRERTGRGTRVDIALMDVQLAMLADAAEAALAGDVDERWVPFRHPVHATADGRHLTVNLGSGANRARWGVVVGAPLPDDAAEADAAVGAWIAGRPAAEVVAALEGAEVPYGLVRSVPEAVAHPHVAERGLVATVDDQGTPLRLLRSPLRLDDVQAGPTAGPPRLGGDTAAVLAEAGLAGDEVEALVAAGVAWQAP